MSINHGVSFSSLQTLQLKEEENKRLNQRLVRFLTQLMLTFKLFVSHFIMKIRRLCGLINSFLVGFVD